MSSGKKKRTTGVIEDVLNRGLLLRKFCSSYHFKAQGNTHWMWIIIIFEARNVKDANKECKGVESSTGIL